MSTPRKRKDDKGKSKKSKTAHKSLNDSGPTPGGKAKKPKAKPKQEVVNLVAPEPRPELVTPPNQAQHAIRSVVGSDEPADGSQIDRDEERRALAKIKFDAERAARAGDIPEVGMVRADEVHRRTDLSSQLRDIAQKPMNDAAIGVIRAKGKQTMTYANGDKSETELSVDVFVVRPSPFFDEIRKVMSELKKTLSAALGKVKGRLGFSTKVGDLHVTLNAEVEREPGPSEVVVQTTAPTELIAPSGEGRKPD